VFGRLTGYREALDGLQHHSATGWLWKRPFECRGGAALLEASGVEAIVLPND